ncbi:MAG: hypothetical protein ACKVPZ_10020 [Burkholderiaceae bacterium]
MKKIFTLLAIASFASITMAATLATTPSATTTAPTTTAPTSTAAASVKSKAGKGAEKAHTPAATKHNASTPLQTGNGKK